MTTANNVTKLRDDLFEVFENLKSGKVQPKVATEMINAAGKIINSAKVELEYYAQRKEAPTVAFFKDGKK